MVSKGDIIKAIRKEKNLKQYQVAENICEISTLSKIENGKQNPNQFLFKELISAMGEDPEKYTDSMSLEEKDILELDYDIVNLISEKKYEEAKKLLKKLEKLTKNIGKSGQIIVKLYTTIINKNLGGSTKEAIETMEKLIEHKPDIDYSKKVMSLKNMRNIMFLAVCYIEVDDKQGVNILYQLKKYIEQKVTDKPSFANIYSGITYNLSSALIESDEYEEALEIVDDGLDFCERYFRYSLYEKLMFSKAKILFELNKEEKKVDVKIDIIEILLHSYLTAKKIDKADVCKEIKKYIVEKNIDINMPLSTIL